MTRSNVLKPACAETMRGAQRRGFTTDAHRYLRARLTGSTQQNALLTENLTAFQARVYSALCEVPEGKVVTYKDLAAQIGCKSSQAVGQALKSNPYAPKVPCHRVVSSDLSIGGFQGAREGTKISKKIQLLTREGVKFNDNGSIDESSVFHFSRPGRARSWS